MGDFSDVLAEAIHTRGASRASLARFIDTTPRALSYYLSGKRNPTFETLGRMAEFLKGDFVCRPGLKGSDWRFLPRPDAAADLTDANVSVVGWARCGLRGEGPTREMKPVPAPVGIEPTRSFYAVARGNSMRPEGIADGDYALVTWSRAPRAGDRVWLRDVEGLAMMKRLIEERPDSYLLRGWLDPEEDLQQVSYTDEIMRSAVSDIHPVSMVLDGKPGGPRPPALRIDPRAAEFGNAPSIADRLADALGLAPGATEDDIVTRVAELRRTADAFPKVREAANDADQLAAKLKTIQDWMGEP